MFRHLLTKVAHLIQSLPMIEQTHALNLLVQSNLKTLVHALTNIQ